MALELNLSNTTAADSFQNVFSQIASSDSPAQGSNYTPGSPTNKPINDAAALVLPASSIHENKSQSAIAQNAVQNSNHGKPSATGVFHRSGKQETSNHSTSQIQKSLIFGTGVDDSSSSSVTVSATPISNTVLVSTISTKFPPSNVLQNGLPIAAANALGGLKSLSGSAFALHITPSANQGNPSQGSANQDNANQEGANRGDENVNALLPVPDNAAQPSGGPLALHMPSSLPLADSGANLPLSASAGSLSSPLPGNSSDSQPDATPSALDSVKASETGSEEPSGAPQTVRTVQMQLGGDGQSRVELRLVEHAGGLSVSVRASDGTLTKGLQENLPDLSARLAAEKYQTHTFLPGTGTSNGGSTPGSSEQPSDWSHEQSGGQSFSHGGDGGGRQQNGQSGGQRQQDQESVWWRQMAALGKLSHSNSISSSEAAGAATPAANQFVNQ